MEVDEQEMMQIAEAFQPGLHHWVSITHINNPASFYVRPMRSNKMLMELELKIPNRRPRRFYMQQCVVLKCRSIFIRGRIVNIDDSRADDLYFDIFAIDYGYVYHSVSSSRIWKCRRCVLNRSPLAFHCKLTNCFPIDGDEWSEESIETLTDYIVGEKAKMMVVDKTSTKLIVDMSNTCADSISNLMSMTGFSLPNPRADVVYRPQTPPPPPPPQQEQDQDQTENRECRSG